MNSAQKAYVARVLPSAQKASAKLGIAPELIAAWWTWETDYGRNETWKVSNHAGIKSASSGKDFTAGQYAGYTSDDSFVQDYVRLLNLPGWRGYDKILAAARANPRDYAGITWAHNASAWSEADYNVSTITKRAQEIAAMMGTAGGGSGNAQTAAVCPVCSASLRLSSSE